jgi:hypothetical protein
MCAIKNIESLLIILTKTKQKNKSLLIKLNIRFYFFDRKLKIRLMPVHKNI